MTWDKLTGAASARASGFALAANVAARVAVGVGGGSRCNHQNIGGECFGGGTGATSCTVRRGGNRVRGGSKDRHRQKQTRSA